MVLLVTVKFGTRKASDCSEELPGRTVPVLHTVLGRSPSVTHCINQKYDKGPFKYYMALFLSKLDTHPHTCNAP